MPAAAPKRPKSASAPKAPKKPTSKSKTGNSACSQAASNWQLAIRGKATIEPDTYKTLAKCRGMLRTSKAADGRAAAGYNLSDQGAAAIKGRLQSRFDRDLVSDKSRAAKVKELLAGRAAKQAAPVAAKPAAAVAAKSAGQAQDDRLRRLGAGTDVEVKRKRDWRQSQVASARNSLIHSREDRASLQQSRDAINYTTRDRELPWMVDGVPITGDPNHRPQIKAPIARYTAARKEKAGQLVKERSERTISESDRKRAMSIAKRVTKAPSRKQAAPVAKPAAAQAPAFSRNGQLAPGRGVDAPERASRLQAINNKIKSRTEEIVNEDRKTGAAKTRSQHPYDSPQYQKLIRRGLNNDRRGESILKARNKIKSIEQVTVPEKFGYQRGSEKRNEMAGNIWEARKRLQRLQTNEDKKLATYKSEDVIRFGLASEVGGNRHASERTKSRDSSRIDNKFNDWWSARQDKGVQEIALSKARVNAKAFTRKTNAVLPKTKPAPAPAPAKFTRNGELAPGRGTSERSAKAAQLGRYRQILPSVDGSATQPRLIQTGPTKTQHLVATVRSSNKYGLMRQRATANKERISENFGFRNITSSGDKRWENTDFRGRTLSEESRGESAVKSRIDDLREKRADRPSDPTEARRSSPFELRQIQERAATRVEPAPAKFSRNGQMAPGRGQDDPSYGNRALRVHDKAHARAKVLMRGVDGTRSTRWEQQQRSNELRLTVENLKPAVIRKIQKDVDAEKAAIAAYDAKQAASAPKPKAKPAPVQASTRKPMYRPLSKLERGSNTRQKAVKGQVAELKQKRENRAVSAGTIPISYKSSVPKGFTAELKPAADAGKNILLAIKPVSKSFGIQARDKKTQFGVVHSESGKSLTWKSLTSKDATRGAKAADYLTRRAEREASTKGIDALLKKPKYIRTLVQFFDRKAIQQ